jgi:chromosome segregation ATPase
VSYDVNALNLDLIDMSFDSFKVGDRYPFEALDIQETLQVIGIQINSENPQKHRLTIGEKYRTLSQYQAEINRRTLKIGELESEVTRQQEALQQTKELLSGQIGNLQTALENINTSEIPELQEAIENLLDSVSDLADIVDSINIPGLATETEPGLLSASDKLKLNRLTVTAATDLDNLRNKLALLTVTQSINLDQLYQDVEGLKNAR